MRNVVVMNSSAVTYAPKKVSGFWLPRASPQSRASEFLVFFFFFAMKRCPIAAKIAGSIGILPCCVLNDFFTQGHERLADLWGLS